ncbi:hypothetical protein [Acidovorax sp. BLS4]|uniref:hypothetical protein n=1 Tax=Acidovorax sp. BLS4 TaxID=3273430 RepID=UPI002943DE69|nr:hypothetical protein [Paracidovorax avenae]WOI45287.1 hypothetical protein R1Z03_22670 [Paracidovorax avenae]
MTGRAMIRRHVAAGRAAACAGMRRPLAQSVRVAGPRNPTWARASRGAAGKKNISATWIGQVEQGSCG